MGQTAHLDTDSTEPTGSGPAWWQWPSVLSLDVPIITVLWQRLFGSTLGAPVRWRESLLLALAVWLIYSADRLLDGLRGEVITQRHYFYRARRRSVLGLWLLVMAGTLGLALMTLSAPELVGAALLGTAMLGYFLSRHAGRPEGHPKESQIAVLFALGVSFVPFIRGSPPLPLLLATLLLAYLIFLNCAFIALWEQGYDLEPAPFAHRHPRLARHLPSLALLLLLGCALTGVLFPATLPLVLALAGSALLLNILHRDPAARLGPDTRRVLGDAALLTPLLIALLWLHV